MEATTTQRQQVTVTLGITSEEGETQIVQRTIPAGPTHVPVLKAELQVPEDSALWVIDKAGKKKVLGDHETHDVKEGDHFEALVKGGVS
jgi:hypothetical protein